jgi:cytochrome c oxidase assembly factor CtaG
MVAYAYAFYRFHRHGQLQRLVQRGLIKRRQPYYFAAGLAILSIALLSPIDRLANLLFTMHMTQHLLMMMVAPPLLLLGLPVPVVRWLILEFRLRKALAWLTSPIVAYVLFNGNLLLWHVPVLYESAMRNEVVHELQHALFFYTAFLFWWRVFDPTHGWFPSWRWPPARWLYLLVTAPPSYVLGSILWASNAVLYPYFTQVPRVFGISALWDQRYGGLLMWIHGWMYMMASMIVFYIWYDPTKAPGQLEGEDRW